MPATSSAWTDVGAGDVARAEDPQRHDRVRGLRFAHDEPNQQRQGDGSETERLRIGPALLCRGLDDRVHAEHQRGGDQQRAGRVGALVEADALVALDQPRGEERGRDRDRDVDEEDPVPADRLGEDAAGEQPDRATGRGDEGVDADRLRLLPGLGEHRHDHPEDHGRAHRAADPLNEAAGDEHPLGLGHTADDRGDREQRQPGHEHVLTADEVAEPAGEQQQAAEGDQVAVDDPGEARLREAEVILDRRQRDVDDGHVEDDHQHARAEHVKGDPALAVCACFSFSVMSCSSSSLAGSGLKTGSGPAKLIGRSVTVVRMSLSRPAWAARTRPLRPPGRRPRCASPPAPREVRATL